jgi:uncharacterized phage-associated protein
MSSEEFMPTKLQRLLLFIMQNLDRELGSIELAKLVYLADLEKVKFLGETISGEEYYWANFGPLARNFLGDLRLMLDFEIKRTIQPNRGFSGIPKKCHILGDKPRFEHELEPINKSIVHRVLAKYGNLSPVELEKEAYDTEPMQKEGLERFDNLDFSVVRQDERFLRWMEKLKNQEWKDDRYHELLDLELEETKEILASA